MTGSIGLLGTKPSWDLMMDCDTLLMIGSGFPYSEFLPKEGQARGVQIDIKPDMLSLRYPMEVNLVGDAAETLRALLPLLEPEDRQRLAQGDRERTSQNGGRRWKSARMAGANPVNPQRVTWELSPRLPDRAIITSRFGLLRQLVCARSENPPRHDVLAFGRARLDGRRGALRDRRQVRASRIGR